jgi:hypothetical protein
MAGHNIKLYTETRVKKDINLGTCREKKILKNP